MTAAGTLERLYGHWWTAAALLRHRLRSPALPPSLPWSTTTPAVRRPDSIRLTGLLHTPSGARELVVLVHGLGGSVSSYYMERTAIAAHQAGMGCLRFHLRGADREGQDIYHAGLTADLEAALASPELAIFETLYVLGFSLGGNTALLWARSPTNPRVKAVATVCSPLDLDASCHFIDRPSSVLYRHYILDSLKEMYAEVASRWPVPIPVREARKIHYLREWDERMVSPYHGFAGADDYYRQTSAAYALPELAIPALVVAAENDPIVGASTIQPSLDGNLPGVEVHWLGRGGHVGCPPNIDLGQGSPVGLEAQILTWFRATAAAAS